MSEDGLHPGPADRSSSARLARAAERLSILAHELDIAVSTATALEPHLDMIASISNRLTGEVLDLAEIGFAVAEDAVSSSPDARAERCAAALGRVSRIIEPVFEAASELAAHLVICAEEAARDRRPLTTQSLAALDGPITAILAENQELITGAGVATARGALADHELWLQWWVHGPRGPVRLVPQLDPDAADFYDYPAAVWFSPSARDLAPHLAPPHFDDGGTDTWMVTATVPVVVRERLVGLACAELTLERIGTLVAPALRAMPAPSALVSPEGLVVASTHPGMRPGLLAHPALRDRAAPASWFEEVASGVTVACSPALPWGIATDWTAGPLR